MKDRWIKHFKKLPGSGVNSLFCEYMHLRIYDVRVSAVCDDLISAYCTIMYHTGLCKSVRSLSRIAYYVCVHSASQPSALARPVFVKPLRRTYIIFLPMETDAASDPSTCLASSFVSCHASGVHFPFFRVSSTHQRAHHFSPSVRPSVP